MGESDGLRQWSVAGGVLEQDGTFLLVHNRRRNGDLDWSTPGGVIDEGESVLQGLTREVLEETGLTVDGWTGPLYRVEVTAPDHGFFLQVEAHRAISFTGEIVIDDPDGIVVGAEFVDLLAAKSLLDGASPWVAEPLLDHFADGIADGRLYAYELHGTGPDDRRVTKL